MGDSTVRSLQNGVILEDFVVSVSVSDLEGKVYFSLCVYQHARMDRALGTKHVFDHCAI